MIQQTDLRILNLMLEKIDKLFYILKEHSLEEIEYDFTLSDSIQFEFEKLYEDSTRLSNEFRVTHPEFPYSQLRSIRNRVAHNYESVIIKILIDTIQNDLQDLRTLIATLIN